MEIKNKREFAKYCLSDIQVSVYSAETNEREIVYVKSENDNPMEKDFCPRRDFCLADCVGMCYADGVMYIGRIKDGLPNGKGTLFNIDGEEYIGNFENGRPKGLIFYRNVNGKRGRVRFGKGIEISVCRSIDERIVQSGVRREFPDGDVYVGELNADGEPSGFGERIGRDGSIQKGLFLNGVLHGTGRLTFANGNEIAGLFKHGAANGFCLKTFSNGEKIFGVFENGSLDGWCMRVCDGGIVRIERKIKGETVGDGFAIDADGHVCVLRK